MKPVTKKDWIDALRSGEFKQGTRALAKRDRETGTTYYCCLGVLAIIAGVGVRMPPRHSQEIEMLFSFDGVNVSSGTIPEAFQNNIVSDLRLGALPAPGPDLKQILSSMNDNGATFEDIATYLEELA